ncbi:MAG: substrate-binding domain-containing protein [Synergistaceae bacterium]|jgi:ribose transport system substrate-binding protein|nr:substrate-binding domain-containing protein [Synergistaceae bacterium]
MKKVLALLMAVAIIFSLAACGSISEAAPEVAVDPVLTEAIENAKALESAYSEWDGPTTGPTIVRGKKIAIIIRDMAFGGDVLWGSGAEKAAQAAGWEYITMDGQADNTVTLSCFSQAISLGVNGIITTANTASLQSGIQEALDHGIPTVGIHASSVVGPDEFDNLLYNNTTTPEAIGRAMADFVIADSNGRGRVLIVYNDSHSIANAKGNAMRKRIEECKTMELLGFITIGGASQTVPPLTATWVATYGPEPFYVMTVSDTILNYMIPVLRNGGVPPESVRLVGSDGEESAYERIRNGNEYQIATVPEPSLMFGYMAVDELNRYFNGKEQYVWSPSLHIVTKNNVNIEGVPENVWDPSNGFAEEYRKIWGL